MIPPIQQLLEASGALVAIVGDRIFQATAPADAAQPYVVWTLVSGVPANNLSELPQSDDQRVQVDFYALSAVACRQAAQAGRDAIETYADIVFGPWNTYEGDTKLYRWSFDAQTIEDR